MGRGGLFSSFSSLSEDCDSFFSKLGLLKSNAVPGVLGVLIALPKLANAPLPLPSPKAEEAPALVGDASAAEDEPIELKGLLLLLKLPKRLAEGVSLLSRLSLRSDLLVDRLNLLVLLIGYC